MKKTTESIFEEKERQILQKENYLSFIIPKKFVTKSRKNHITRILLFYMPRETHPPDVSCEIGIKRHFISRFRQYSGYAIELLRTLENDSKHSQE